MIFGPFGFNQLKSNYLLFTIQIVSGLKPVLRFSFRPLHASSFKLPTRYKQKILQRS